MFWVKNHSRFCYTVIGWSKNILFSLTEPFQPLKKTIAQIHICFHRYNPRLGRVLGKWKSIITLGSFFFFQILILCLFGFLQERSKTYVSGSNAPWIVRKTSFQSNRVVPNDDLVLNKARQQKVAASTLTTLSTTAPTTTSTTSTTTTGNKSVNIVPRHPKSFSTGHIDQTGLEVFEVNIDGEMFVKLLFVKLRTLIYH